jgi:arginine-tRNA-protein transferase
VAAAEEAPDMDITPGRDDRPNRDRSARSSARPVVRATLLAPLQQFFATSPIACPYIAGRAERKLIVELAGNGAATFYDELSRAGFRRSHRYAYRPSCRDCFACVPVRIAALRFTHSRSTRRIRNANRDVIAGLAERRATPEQFRLFAAYQRARHGDSEMATMTYADYRGMVEDSPVRTRIVEFRDPEGLVAASLVDLLDDGISAVYSFFDPRHARRSLGSWCILWLVEECRRRGRPYVYLGYWIAESPKMAYKARFPALERLTPEGWRDFFAAPAGCREAAD